MKKLTRKWQSEMVADGERTVKSILYVLMERTLLTDTQCKELFIIYGLKKFKIYILIILIYSSFHFTQIYSSF